MKNKTNPRFSIIIPCYNEELYINDTLESLFKQDYKGKYEVIVVNNNSTDQTVKIVKNYPVKLINEKQAGVCAARQAGTKIAKGEIIISTDADTTFKPNWLSVIDEEFKENKGIIALAGKCSYVSAPWWGKIYPYILFGYVQLSYLLFRSPAYITATNIAFYKTKFNGYNTSLTQGGDELALLQQLKQKGKVKFKFNLTVYTSARRLKKGLWYNVFVSFFYYYLFAYHLNRLFNRTIIGPAPAYRKHNPKYLKLSPILGLFIVFILIGVFVTGRIRGSFEFTKDAYLIAKNAIHKIYLSIV
jgi:glycosyltransferase involved in cell wall biosynthesis